MLSIRDRTFEVSAATFGAILSLDEDDGWQIRWQFDVQTIGRRFDDQTWCPHLYAETLRLSLPAPAALPGHSVQVLDAFDDDDLPNFTLYVFEHAPAYDICMSFGQWRGGAIEITIEGKADVYWGDDYGTSLPVRVECPFSFEGINVFDRSEDSARSHLAEFYDPTAFVAERARVGFDFRLRTPGSA